MRRAGGIVLTAALAFGAAACGGDDGGGAPETAGGDPDRPIRTMLGAVPDTEALASSVIVNDLAGARQALDLDPGEDDPEEVLDALVELSVRAESLRLSVSEFAGGQSEAVEAREDAWGFSPGQVDRDVVAGSPPEHLQVIDGRFDPDAVADAVESDEGWSDALETEEVDGTTVYSWLDDDEIDPERLDEVHRIGESVRLAVLADDRLAWARNDEVIESAITPESTLADREDLGEVADVLDDAGAVTAVLSAAADPGDYGSLDRHEAYGVGEAVDDDGDPLLVIALWHPDDDRAEDAVAEMEDLADGGELLDDQTYGDIDVDRIEQDGRVAVAVLGVDQPGLARQLAFAGHPLFAIDLPD